MKTTPPTAPMLALLAKIAAHEDYSRGNGMDVARPEYRTGTVCGLRDRGLIVTTQGRDRTVETKHGRGNNWYYSTDHHMPVILANLTDAGRAALAKVTS